jgi:hypothetical protein
MNNLSQPPQPAEPDMGLLYLGSLFETLDYTLPPERDEAKLDALAWHILDKRPKTLLGLAIRARAEKHLCRYLWTVDFERLPPSDQADCVVIECAMLLSSRPCDRGEPAPKAKPRPGGSRAGGILCLAQQEDHPDYSPPERHWRAAGGLGMLD